METTHSSLTAGAAQRLDPNQARAATSCTKCHAFHGGNAYTAERTYSGIQGVYQARPIAEAKAPTYSHCADCAVAYAKRLTRRAERKAMADRCKRTKSNLGRSDCTIVAISVSTGERYDKVEMLAKRLVGYQWGKGLSSSQLGIVLEHVAFKRGLRLEQLDTLGLPTVNRVVVQHGHQGSLVIGASKRTTGHAMAATKGTLHNAAGGWARARVHTAWLVTK